MGGLGSYGAWQAEQNREAGDTIATLRAQLAESQAREQDERERWVKADEEHALAIGRWRRDKSVYEAQLQAALARAEAAEHRLEKAEFGRRECATRLTAAEARLETAVKALELPTAIVSLLTSTEIQAHPFPWKGHHQPWPDVASQPEKVIDRRGKHPFSGNWKEVCAAIELAWRCINYVSNVPDALAILAGDHPGDHVGGLMSIPAYQHPGEQSLCDRCQPTGHCWEPMNCQLQHPGEQAQA